MPCMLNLQWLKMREEVRSQKFPVSPNLNIDLKRVGYIKTGRIIHCLREYKTCISKKQGHDSLSIAFLFEVSRLDCWKNFRSFWSWELSFVRLNKCYLFIYFYTLQISNKLLKCCRMLCSRAVKNYKASISKSKEHLFIFQLVTLKINSCLNLSLETEIAFRYWMLLQVPRHGKKSSVIYLPTFFQAF